MAAARRRDLIKFVVQNLGGKSFGGLLKTEAAVLTMKEGAEKSQAMFTYCVPASLCNPLSSDSSGMMGVGAVLAVFDELSTYSFMLKDATGRPGASVHLSAGDCD